MPCKYRAQLNGPEGISVDTFGNLIISDTSDQVIREVVSSSGIGTNYGVSMSTANDIYLVAGNGTAGFIGDGGPAISAELHGPANIALDGPGNIFIADYSNNRIRSVSTTGTITTVAGNGTSGSSGDNGPATSAELNGPTGVAVNNQGNLYIADWSNNRVREVMGSTGDIYTVAGNGTSGSSGDNGLATSAELNGPRDVVLGNQGSFVIDDMYNSRIREVSNFTAMIATVAGTPGQSGYAGDNGNAKSSKLNGPGGVATDIAGNLFISDSSNNRIREVNALTSNILTVAGNGTPCPTPTSVCGDGGPATSAELNNPLGDLIDPSGDIIFADMKDNRIREVALTSHNQFGISMAAGDIYTIAGTGTQGYSGDGGSAIIAELDAPRDIALDSSGNLYIGDGGNNVIREVTTSGTISTIAGNGTAGYSGDGGPATSAEFSNPCCMVLDTSGNIFVSDAGNSRVRVIAATTGTLFGVSVTAGNVYTIAGTGTAGYSGDGGPAINAELNAPAGIEMDSLGNLYFIDIVNHRLREISKTTNIITTVAGNGTAGYSGDGGPANEAELSSFATTLAIDPSDNIYIADANNQIVRLVAFPHPGLMSSSTDSDGNTTTFGYDSLGDATVTTSPPTQASPQGDRTVKSYDDRGEVLISVSGEGTLQNSSPYAYESSSTYDLGGLVLTSTTPPTLSAPNGATTTNVYDPDGNRIKTTDANGNSTTVAYDLDDRQVSTTDALGNTSTSFYNPAGQQWCSVSAISNAAGYTCPGWQPWWATNPPPALSGMSNLAALSCPVAGSTTNCYGVSNSSQGTPIILGSTGFSGPWVQESVPSTGVTSLSSISCFSISTCYAVGSDGTSGGVVLVSANANQGTQATWSVQQTLAGSTSLSSVSCSSTTLCLAVGSSSSNTAVAYYLSGSTWSSITLPSTVTNLSSISCGSTTTCTATGTTTTNNTPAIVNFSYSTSWSASQITGTNLPSGVISLSSIACPSSNTCYSTGASTTGPAIADWINGAASWSTESVPSGVSTLIGSACLSTDLCGAVGTNGATAVLVATFDASHGSTATWGTAKLPTGLTSLSAVSCVPSSSTSECMVSGANVNNQGALLSNLSGSGTWSYVSVPAGVSTTFTDENGNTIQSTSANGMSSYATYDLTGKLVASCSDPDAIAGADDCSSQGDTDNDFSASSNPESVTTYVYNAIGQLISETVGAGSGSSTTTSYTYDADGRKLTTTVASGTSLAATTTDIYNSLGQLTSEESPLPGTPVTYYGYDLAGRKTCMTLPNANGNTCANANNVDSLSYVYNSAGELTNINYHDGVTTNVSYTYNADGTRATMSDATGTTSYIYDGAGELLSSTNGAGAQVSYAYDKVGDTTCISYPIGGTSPSCLLAPSPTNTVVDYSYNNNSQINSVTDWLATPDTGTYAYNPDGATTSLTLKSGTTPAANENLTYQPGDQLSNILWSGASSLSMAYTRNQVGAITQESDTGFNGNSNINYGYDQLSRVTGQSSSSPPPSNTYSYDQASDSTTFTKAGTSYTQSYSTGQQLCWQISGPSANSCSTPPAGATTYSYDLNGNRVGSTNGSATTSYGYDQAGNLCYLVASFSAANCSLPPAGSTTYSYNGDGLRMSTTTGSSTTHFTWSSSSKLLMDGANAYIYGNSGAPIEEINLTTNTPEYLVTDSLGSVRASYNAAGVVTNGENFDSYGDVTYGTPVSTFGYSGGYSDPSGLIYLIHRYYDPSTGQFVSVDPMESSTLTPYGYATGDPVNGSDPSGKYTVGVCGGIGAEIDSVVSGVGIAGNVCAFIGSTGWGGRITSLSLSETGFQQIAGGPSGFGGGVNLSIGFQVSTASKPHDLAGPFDQWTVTGAALDAGGAVDVFWGSESAGKRVIGADISYAPGADASISFWNTYTYVQELKLNLPESFGLKGMMDSISWPSQDQQNKAIAFATKIVNEKAGNSNC